MASAKLRLPGGDIREVFPASKNMEQSAGGGHRTADVSSLGLAAAPQLPIESLSIRYEPNPEIERELNQVEGSLVDHPVYSHEPDDASKYALVIGIARYQGGLPAAEFADRDAEAVKAHLRALGFPERNIFLLTNENATGSRITVNLKHLAKIVDESSTVFFFFSGHGAPDPASGENLSAARGRRPQRPRVLRLSA